MENRAKQSELLFLWDAKLCNPNGDMSADNAPRFDEVDEKAIVSDVRIKRTIRDDLQYRKKELIFINNEEIIEKGLKAEDRFSQLIEEHKKEKLSDLQVFLKCIDNRLFGGVAPKSGIQLVGTVQFSWTKSINKTETILKSGTGAFANPKKKSKEVVENSTEETDENIEETNRNQKTFRADNYIPYGLFAMYGTVNRIQAEKASTSEVDILKMLDSLWMGTKFLNTRSKEGQKSRFMLRIIYSEESKYFIGLLDELISLRNKDSSMIRTLEEADIDFDRLINVVNMAKGEIDKVMIVIDESMKKYKEKLEKIEKVEFIDELNIIK